MTFEKVYRIMMKFVAAGYAILNYPTNVVDIQVDKKNKYVRFVGVKDEGTEYPDWG